MVKELENYIKKHRKKGYTHDHIASYLNRHGWHQKHIGRAIVKVKQAETQRFIAGSIWYILLIFVVTIGIMQVGKFTGAATIDDLYCVSDRSGLGNWELLSSQKTCCRQIASSQCSALEKPELLKDPGGRAFYKADYSCVGPLGLTLINEAGLVHCR